MRCFNHAEIRAVGMCKSCAKGICHDCLTELATGLACKGRCEERVEAWASYSKYVLRQFTGKNTIKSAGWYSQFGYLLAVLFAGVGNYQLIKEGFGSFGLFHVILGIVFFLWGWQQQHLIQILEKQLMEKAED